jgi:hypothetical protein
VQVVKLQLFITHKITTVLHVFSGGIEVSPVEVFGEPGPTFFPVVTTIAAEVVSALWPGAVDGPESSGVLITQVRIDYVGPPDDASVVLVSALTDQIFL